MSAPKNRVGFCGSNIVLGVTGGIAAYKAVELTSRLVQAGAHVHVVMTEGGTEFVRPLTFEALTRNRVFTSVFDGWHGESAGHVTLAANADVVVVAPTTANVIAKFAHGQVDDMLGAALLATTAPVILAPAMEHHMWHHPATQANVRTLVERGVHIVEPDRGHLASGMSGDGRLASLESLLGAIRQRLATAGPLVGRSVVVTAGGTREAIDPVRFLGNRSSGQMGIAIAWAAMDAGACVTLVAAPSVEQLPYGMKIMRVESARDMEQAVRQATVEADVLIMAAAVADFRPRELHHQKLKKRPSEPEMTLELVKNPDIVSGIDGSSIVKIGFAAETENLLENAANKLRAKDLAMIVANDAVSTIGSGRVQATLLFRDGRDPVELAEQPKDEAARRIVDFLPELIKAGRP